MGSHGSLQGRVCVVTGASRGIGKACAQALAAEGAHLGLCAFAAPPEEPAGSGRRLSQRCDVSDGAQVQAFFASVRSELGLPDVVVLNAGTLERAPLGQLTEAQWDRVLGTNLKSAYLCSRAVWDAMRARGSGRLIAIGSISGTLGSAEASAYNASTWGLTGFMKSLAEEGRAHGLFCATVLPSGVDTDMIRQTPFAPVMRPDDVARVVRYLAADAPFAMTGSAVEVFG
jgi:NAD(P)-dependent dehydrogenase (short-subunit alcohol dehydrogenase family)